MTAPRVGWAPRAEDDLHGIFLYILNAGSPLAASRHVQEIAERGDRLAAFPFAGRARDDVRIGVRTLPFKNVLFVYEVLGRSVRILRVLGQAQDYEQLLRQLRTTP
jgi:plasmid stabilization system protein ParE